MSLVAPTHKLSHEIVFSIDFVKDIMAGGSGVVSWPPPLMKSHVRGSGGDIVPARSIGFRITDRLELVFLPQARCRFSRVVEGCDLLAKISRLA